jgi:hypothetical protein
MPEWSERLVGLARTLNKHDDKWPRVVGEPSGANAVVSAPMHNSHAGVLRVER